MREYEDADGLDATEEVTDAISSMERDARFVLTTAAALAGPTTSAEVYARAITLVRNAYFALLNDAAFAEFSVGVRGGSTIPQLFGCRPLDRRP